MVDAATRRLIDRLTVPEKALLVAGASYWSTHAIARLNIPSLSITDGPHGLRRQIEGGDHLGIGDSAPATCFPPAAGLASSWNPELLERVGAALGDEAREQGVNVLLGPGVNIKRSPLCGRNFEYFSEDPLLSGMLGASWVRGLQSRGVGASLKHFAANNQETDRMTVSAEVDERTLREIYLPAFERIVRDEQPATVMCSYNRINGVYASQDAWLLTELLRDEWDFEGLVISDWGAVDDRVPALVAGLDLEFPGPQPTSAAAIVDAVRAGSVPEGTLDRAVARVLKLIERTSLDTGNQSPAPPATSAELYTRNHALAREAALHSIVLLRNEGEVLPLAPGARVAVIGEFARTPRIQGAGSSQVNPTRIDTPLAAISEVADVTFAAGYPLRSAAAVHRPGHAGASPHGAGIESLHDEAVRVAAAAESVVLFVGLPEGFESEGFDRTHLRLPDDHDRLIREVAAVNPRTIVVLTNGGVVELDPWHDDVPAILEAWLLGQGGGSALADVLFGVVSPTGRLAESMPLRLADNPSYLNFPGEGDTVRYAEGVFVGYRYYETVEVAVRYPFGHGLSYTTFTHSDLEVSRDGSHVSLTVTNVGAVEAADVVQVYVGRPGATHPRRELRGFARVVLSPGASTRVEIEVDDRAWVFWDIRSHSWLEIAGEFTVEVGTSARDIVLATTVQRRGPRPGPLSLDSRIVEFMEHPVTGPILRRAAGGAADREEGGVKMLDMVASMPLRRVMRFPGVGDQLAKIGILIAIANNPVVRWIATQIARLRRR